MRLTSEMATRLTAEQFIKRLKALRSAEELKKIQRYFKSAEGEYAAGDKFIGVRIGQVFALAKEFIDMPLREIEKLLESPFLDKHAATMPRTLLRYAIEKLDPKKRAHYMNAKKAVSSARR